MTTATDSDVVREVPWGQWFDAYLSDSIMRPSKSREEADARSQLTFMAMTVDKLWTENQRLLERIRELQTK